MIATNSRPYRRLSTAALLLGLGVALPACNSGKPKKKDYSALEKEFAKYIRSDVPKGVKRLDVDFGGRVQLIGYEVAGDGKPKPGEQVRLKLYWRTLDQLENGWVLFTHVTDGHERRIANIDKSGKFRGKLPPPAWKVDKIYVDELTFKLPKSRKKVRVVAGLWNPDLPGDNRWSRMTVRKGRKDRQERAIVLEVHGARKPRGPKVVVPKLGPSEALKVDGELSEGAWSTAVRLPAVRQLLSNAPASGPLKRADGRLLYDDENVYLAVEVHDEKVAGGAGKADGPILTTDAVRFLIGDARKARPLHDLAVGPDGKLRDARVQTGPGPRKAVAGATAKGAGSGKPAPSVSPAASAAASASAAPSASGSAAAPETTAAVLGRLLAGDLAWGSKATVAVKRRKGSPAAGKSPAVPAGYVVELALPWAAIGHDKPALGLKFRANLIVGDGDQFLGWATVKTPSRFRPRRFGSVILGPVRKGAAPAGSSSAAPSATPGAPAPSSSSK